MKIMKIGFEPVDKSSSSVLGDITSDVTRKICIPYGEQKEPPPKHKT